MIYFFPLICLFFVIFELCPILPSFPSIFVSIAWRDVIFSSVGFISIIYIFLVVFLIVIRVFVLYVLTMPEYAKH